MIKLGQGVKEKMFIIRFQTFHYLLRVLKMLINAIHNFILFLRLLDADTIVLHYYSMQWIYLQNKMESDSI